MKTIKLIQKSLKIRDGSPKVYIHMLKSLAIATLNGSPSHTIRGYLAELGQAPLLGDPKAHQEIESDLHN